MIRIRKNILQLAGLIALSASATAYSATTNFTCPQPSEIQSTDFTAPSIWVAPPMPHAAKGVVGVGLGGKEAKELLGIESANVNHKKGWVCVYKSRGGLAPHEYESKIRQVLESNHYLKKYLADVNKSFDNAEPFLNNYPHDVSLGFVGYQKG